MKIEIIRDPLALLERANKNQRTKNASRLSQAVHREKENRRTPLFHYEGMETEAEENLDENPEVLPKRENQGNSLDLIV